MAFDRSFEQLLEFQAASTCLRASVATKWAAAMPATYAGVIGPLGAQTSGTVSADLEVS